jgi:phage shock protein C
MSDTSTGDPRKGGFGGQVYHQGWGMNSKQCGDTVKTMKRLYRSQKDRMLAGVAGGIGEYFDIDPTFIRLIWVILGLTGTGIIAYIIAWIIIPEEGSISQIE